MTEMIPNDKLQCPACDFCGDREELRIHFLKKMKKKDLALHLVNVIVARDFFIRSLEDLKK
jgi:hypothetical protein